jgi:hypothetical protein
LSVLSQREKVTGTGVQERITGRSGRGEDHCIDDVRQDWNTCANDSDDPGTTGSPGTSTEQTIVIGGYYHTDGKGSEHVKEQDTPEHTLDSLGDVLARILRLTSS